MSDKNFKVKNGLTIQGEVDTLITADNAGGILVNGNTVGPSNATPSVPGSVFGTTPTGFDQNTGLGYFSLKDITSGNRNTASGYQSLRYNTSGSTNTASGNFSLRSNITGSSNTAIGHNSLYSNESGSGNTAIGSDAGTSLVGGSNNTLLGFEAEASDTEVYNEITLGNSDITKFRIPGLGIDWTTTNVPTAPTFHPVFAMV
jgi:hypothetical protein